jgi:hypothetical protein
MLTAGPRDQFPRWRRSRKRLSVCSVLRCPDLWLELLREFSARFKKDALHKNNVTRCFRQFVDACVKAGVLVDPVCLMTTLKECVRRFSEVPASQWLEQARNWACQKWRCGRCCIGGYVLNRTKFDWCRPLHQQAVWKGLNFASRCR